jgi:hypothetical protein
MEQSEKNINPKYIAMVFRFKLLQGSGKTFPNIVKRYKMIEAFKTWYNKHVHELTSDEREYLQANICPVSTHQDDVDKEPKDKDPWDD